MKQKPNGPPNRRFTDLEITKQRDRISSHPNFDDDKFWKFSRSSGLPIGYFDRRPVITADAVVFALAIVVLVLIVTGIVQ